MRHLTLALIMIFSLNSFAQMNIEKAKTLLEEKNISLEHLQQNNAKIILGEGSGAGKAIPFKDIMIIFTKDEAILKSEILDSQFSGEKSLEKLISLEVQGNIIFKDQLSGLIHQ